MAIIDLKTGKVKKDAREVANTNPLEVNPHAPTEQPLGRIINLEDGSFVSPSITTRTKPQAPTVGNEGNFTDAIIEPAISIGGGLMTDVVAGLRGLGNLAFGEGVEESARVTEETREKMAEFFSPETETGKRSLAALGGLINKGVDLANVPISGIFALAELATGQGVEQAVKTINSVKENGLTATFGDRVFEETDSPLMATMAAMLPTAAMELTALRGLKKTKESAPANIIELKQNEAERISAMKADRATDTTGIELFQAQKTLNPDTIQQQSYIADLPEGAIKARDALLKQNQQAVDAVDSILGAIAPAEQVGGGAERVRNAAQNAIEVAKQIRREKASPLYQGAFDIGADVDVNSVIDSINNRLDDLPPSGEISKQLLKVRTLIKGKKEGQPSLKRLHNSKLEIDQMIEKVGEGSLGNTTKRELVSIRNELLEKIHDASPAYKEAGQEFARLSEPVNKIVDSPIGRIAKLDDVQLKQVSNVLFDPSMNIDVINKAKKTIQEVDPGAWDGIVRTEIEKRLGAIRSDIGDLSDTASTENVPAQIHSALFSTEKKRNVLFQSVDGETRKNLKYLESALRRASKGRPGGSQTAVRRDIERRLKGGVFQSIREFFKAPIETTASIGEDAAFNLRKKALAEALFDPTWKSEFQQLRDLPPESTKAKRVMENILNSALITLPTVDETEENKEQK